MKTYKEFPLHLYNAWYELHWTRAETFEQAKAFFSARGMKGEFYKTNFGWWYPIEEQ